MIKLKGSTGSMEQFGSLKGFHVQLTLLYAMLRTTLMYYKIFQLTRFSGTGGFFCFVCSSQTSIILRYNSQNILKALPKRAIRQTRTNNYTQLRKYTKHTIGTKGTAKKKKKKFKMNDGGQKQSKCRFLVVLKLFGFTLHLLQTTYSPYSHYYVNATLSK